MVSGLKKFTDPVSLLRFLDPLDHYKCYSYANDFVLSLYRIVILAWGRKTIGNTMGAAE